MRILKLILLFSLFLSCHSKNNNIERKQETKANKIKLEFERHLEIIEKYLDGNLNHKLLNLLSKSILYLEDFTGIISEGDMTVVGKLYPTKKDFESWKKWYEKYFKVKWKSPNSFGFSINMHRWKPIENLSDTLIIDKIKKENKILRIFIQSENTCFEMIFKKHNGFIYVNERQTSILLSNPTQLSKKIDIKLGLFKEKDTEFVRWLYEDFLLIRSTKATIYLIVTPRIKIEVLSHSQPDIKLVKKCP